MRNLCLSKFLTILLLTSSICFTNISCINQPQEENPLSAPTNVTVGASSKTNYVNVTWENSSGAAYYWIYYNSTNYSSTATYATYSSSGTYGTDIKLSESGTYYFWVKAADGYYGSSSATSDFSEVATYTF